MSSQHNVCEMVKQRLPGKTQLDLSSRFDTIPACDRRSDGHRALANYSSRAAHTAGFTAAFTEVR